MKQGGTIVATYIYNALDQRIGINDSGGGQTWTIYKGTDPDALPYGDFNGSGTLLTRYVSGRGMVNGSVANELLARTSSGGTTAWYLTDKLDSVRDVVSSAGSVLDHVVYDSFGNITTETSASNGDRVKFADMEFARNTGIYYDRAREYNSAIGKFSSFDPLAFASDSNLYRYVRNDDPNSTDRTGAQQDGPIRWPSGDGWDWTPDPPADTPGPSNYNLADIMRVATDTPIGVQAAQKINAEGNNLTVLLVPPPNAPKLYGRMDPGGPGVPTRIYVNPDKNLTAIDAAATLIHELGHALGLSELECRLLEIEYYNQMSMKLGVDVMPDEYKNNKNIKLNPTTGKYEVDIPGYIAHLSDPDNGPGYAAPAKQVDPPPLSESTPPPLTVRSPFAPVPTTKAGGSP